MNAEEVKNIADQAIQQLKEAISLGKSEQLTKYFVMLDRFHRYSFGDDLLILFAEARRLPCRRLYRQKLGSYVRECEKGIVIITPMTIKPKKDREGGGPVFRFNGVDIFDVSQAA